MSTTKEDKRISYTDYDNIEAADEKFKPVVDLELIKVPCADYKKLNDEQRLNWLYVHFLMKNNLSYIKAAKLLTEDQLALLQKEEDERKEEDETTEEEELTEEERLWYMAYLEDDLKLRQQLEESKIDDGKDPDQGKSIRQDVF